MTEMDKDYLDLSSGSLCSSAVYIVAYPTVEKVIKEKVVKFSGVDVLQQMFPSAYCFEIIHPNINKQKIKKIKANTDYSNINMEQAYKKVKDLKVYV